MLAKAIVKRLKEHTKSGREIPNSRTSQGIQVAEASHVADWFYSARSGSTGQSHKSFLRSVLYQLLKDDAGLFHFCRTFYRAGSWSLKRLRSAFKAVAQSGVPVLCVIDALDESLYSQLMSPVSSDSSDGEYRHRPSHLTWLRSVINPRDRMRTKLIILSRPAGDIDEAMEGGFQIVMQQANGPDIRRVVDSGVDSLFQLMQSKRAHQNRAFTESTLPTTDRTSKRSNPFQRRMRTIQKDMVEQERKELEIIRAGLLQKADGVYLWVVTILQMLKDTVGKGVYDLSALKGMLETLPSDLYRLYKRIVKDLEGRLTDYEILTGRAALIWVAEANTWRPLRLQELWDALALPIDLSGHSFIEEALRSSEDPLQRFQRIRYSDWQSIHKSLLDICGPFLDFLTPRAAVDQQMMGEDEEIGPMQVVQLSHQTVKDFLRSEAAGNFFFMEDHALDLFEDGIETYLKICLPETPTAYAPLPLSTGRDWKLLTEEVVEYLDKKLLLSFILKDYLDAAPRSRRCLRVPELYTDVFENSASPPLSHWPPHKYQCYLDQDLKFHSTEYPQSRLFWAVVVGRFFRFACREGYVTAVENLLALGAPPSAGQKPASEYWNAVLVGTLLAIIDAEAIDLVPTVFRISITFGLNIPSPSPGFSNPFDKVACCYIREAAKTCNKELTMSVLLAFQSLAPSLRSSRDVAKHSSKVFSNETVSISTLYSHGSSDLGADISKPNEYRQKSCSPISALNVIGTNGIGADPCQLPEYFTEEYWLGEITRYQPELAHPGSSVRLYGADLDGVREAVNAVMKAWNRDFSGTFLHELGHTLGLRHEFS